MSGLRTQGTVLNVLLAVAVGAVLLAEVVLNDKSSGLSVASVLAVLAAATPLAFCSRHPLAVVVISGLTVFLVLETCNVYETVALPAMVALYSYARATDRRRSILAGLAYVPVVLVAEGIYSPEGVIQFQTAQNLAFIGLPLLAANAVRDRRAYLDALHERVETAERTREEEALRRVGEERLRIARDVHDVVAHSMVAINVQAGVAAHLLDRRPEEAGKSLNEIRRVSGEAITDLRATLGVLREAEERAPVRPSQGLAALDELGPSMRAAGVELDVSRRGGERPLPSAVDAAAYRIVQEALTNVLRHAHATRADVVLEVGTRALSIEVIDDGVGAGVNGNGTGASNGAVPAGSGNGLRGMRERAAALGGQVDAGAAHGGGWRVSTRLPLPGA